MAYAHKFIRLTFGGVLQGSDEVFTVGLNLGTPGADTMFSFDNITDEYLTEIFNAFTTVWTAGGMHIPRRWQLEWVKAALIDTDGKYVDFASNPKELFFPPVAGAVGTAWAPQLSTVVTFVANKRKDPGRYNRIYLPTSGIDATGNGRDINQVSQMAELMRNFVDTLNDIFSRIDPPNGAVLIAASKSGNGSDLPIEGVRVGDIIDTQRRRRNKLAETYVEFEVTN